MQRLQEQDSGIKRNTYRVFSHDVTAAMLVSQTNLVGVELFSYANPFFCSVKLLWMLAT